MTGRGETQRVLRTTGEHETSLDVDFGSDSEPEPCTWWLHDITECGDDAVGERLGFFYCQPHLDRHDALTAMATEEVDNDD